MLFFSPLWCFFFFFSTKRITWHIEVIWNLLSSEFSWKCCFFDFSRPPGWSLWHAHIVWEGSEYLWSDPHNLLRQKCSSFSGIQRNRFQDGPCFTTACVFTRQFRDSIYDSMVTEIAGRSYGGLTAKCQKEQKRKASAEQWKSRVSLGKKQQRKEVALCVCVSKNLSYVQICVQILVYSYPCL